MDKETKVFLRLSAVKKYATEDEGTAFEYWCLRLAKTCSSAKEQRSGDTFTYRKCLNARGHEISNGRVLNNKMRDMSQDGFVLGERDSTLEMRLLESICTEMALKSWDSILDVKSEIPDVKPEPTRKSKETVAKSVGSTRVLLESSLNEQVYDCTWSHEQVRRLIGRINDIPSRLPQGMVETLGTDDDAWLSVRQSILLAFLAERPVAMFSAGVSALDQLLEGVQRSEAHLVFKSVLGTPVRYLSQRPDVQSAIRSRVISCALFDWRIWLPGAGLGHGVLEVASPPEDITDGLKVLRRVVTNRAPGWAALCG